jgi:hypothetical protein
VDVSDGSRIENEIGGDCEVIFKSTCHYNVQLRIFLIQVKQYKNQHRFIVVSFLFQMFARFNHLGLCLGIDATRTSLDRIRRGFDDKVGDDSLESGIVFSLSSASSQYGIV